MSWFWTLIFLIAAFGNFSEAKHKLPSAIVVGAVYCDTCFQQDSPKARHFISGATVAVECKDTISKQLSFRQEAKTDVHGEFTIHLPFPVSKHLKKIKGCSVKLISSSNPSCAVPATAASSSLHLKSRKEGTHIFSAGFFTFKPLKQPHLCNQKPNILNNFRKEAEEKLSPISNPNNNPTFLPPIQDPPSDAPALGQLPNLPLLPPLPRLPDLPRIPFLPPVPDKKTAAKASQLQDKKDIPFLFPPNPFMNPPSIFPPNPFQPPSSPPPSIFPPLFSFPSPPLFNLPPIPGLTPSPPSAPTLRFPLPPFPFQPMPGFPGAPPAEVSSQLQTKSP